MAEFTITEWYLDGGTYFEVEPPEEATRNDRSVTVDLPTETVARWAAVTEAWEQATHEQRAIFDQNWNQ